MQGDLTKCGLVRDFVFLPSFFCLFVFWFCLFVFCVCGCCFCFLLACLLMCAFKFVLFFVFVFFPVILF